MSASPEIMQALQGHTASVQSAIHQLLAQVAEERELREELERRFNKLRVQGGASANDDTIEHKSALSSAIRSWYPNRIRDDLSDSEYREYARAFRTYIRHGDRMLSADEAKAMQVAIDTDGGALAPTQLHNEILRLVQKQAVIRRLARVIPTSTCDLEVPRQLTSVATGWVGEVQARPTTASPTVGKISIVPREWYANPQVTQQLLDDSAFPIESFLAEVIAEQYAIDEDQSFLTGDGISRPRGILTHTLNSAGDSTRPDDTLQYFATGQASTLPSTAAATYDLLQDVIFSMKPRLRTGAVWIGSTSVLAALAKLKDGQSRPLWVDSVAAGTPPTLCGFPVYESELMPTVGAGALPLMFANVNAGYWINDRAGLRILRDPYTAKPYVNFYTTRRVGGHVVRFDAFKVVKVASS